MSTTSSPLSWVGGRSSSRMVWYLNLLYNILCGIMYLLIGWNYTCVLYDRTSPGFT